MVKALTLVSTQTDPYANLATERLLMDVIAPDEQIMFLWQNSNTIVIGRNQDAYRECRVEEFEQDGGRLARRLSGGGAVYHDTGNLNFTFVSPRNDYDVARNMDIICKAVRSFGVAAQLSGRNDIEVDGAKFSGNAFFKTKYACCHHGTLMVAVDTEKLARYLQPDPRKLETRGVDSVKSRVVNLQDIESRITIESLREALMNSFNPQTGQSSFGILEDRLDKQELREERERFASDEWRLGKQYSYDHRFDHRYVWGGVDLQLKVTEGRVSDIKVYSDALDADFIAALEQALKGAAYSAAAFGERLNALAKKVPAYQAMIDDCLVSIEEDFGKGA